MFGRFTYANNGSSMGVDILKNNIKEATTEYLKNVENQVSLLEGMIGGQSKNGVFSPGFITYLRKIGFSEKEIEIIKSLGDVNMMGYTVTDYKSKEVDCFYPVVFLSLTEKANLDKILKRLTGGNISHTKTKQYFKEALLEQAKTMLGDVPDDVVLSKDLNEIWDVILAVDFTGDPRIATTKLRDMDKLPDEVFDDFYSSFKDDVERFVNNSFDDSMFELAGQKFYWIPLNEIPGNE